MIYRTGGVGMHAVKTKKRINLSAVTAAALFVLLILAGLFSGRAGKENTDRPRQDELSADGGGEAAAEETKARVIDPDKPMVALTFDDGPPRSIYCPDPGHSGEARCGGHFF